MCTRPRRPSSPIPRLRRRGYFVYIPEIGRITSTNDVYFDERSLHAAWRCDVQCQAPRRQPRVQNITRPAPPPTTPALPGTAPPVVVDAFVPGAPTPTPSSSLDAAMGRGSSATSSSARLPTPLCTTVLALWGRCWRSVRRSDPCPSRGTPRTSSNTPSTASRG